MCVGTGVQSLVMIRVDFLFSGMVELAGVAVVAIGVILQPTLVQEVGGADGGGGWGGVGSPAGYLTFAGGGGIERF